MVPPSLLEGRRIKGSIMIAPDDEDKIAMIEHGVSRVIYSSKLCIDANGAIASLTMLRSSGFPGYDEKIHKQITTTWQYSPFMINCKPQPICTSVTIIYNQTRYRPAKWP